MSLRSRLRDGYLAGRRLVLKPLAWGRPRTCLPSPCRRILVVRIDRIGDLVLSTPFFRNLRECFPEAEIVLLGRSFARELLETGKWVDRIYSVAADGQAPPALGREGLDLAIDLHCDYILRPARLARRAGAACTIGFDVAGRGAFFDIPVRPGEPKHFIEESLDLLRALGFQPRPYPPEIQLDPGARAAARRTLIERGVDGRYVAFHPGGFYSTQRWPAIRFARLAALVSQLGLACVFIGTEAERPLLDEISESMPAPAVVLCGQPLGTSAAIIGGSTLFIGNNSGPLHLACALNVPSASTMGPTDPVRFWPVSPRARVLRQKRVDDISVEDMFAAANAALTPE